MPKVVVNSLKFYNQLKEGADFSTSSDPNYNLAGAVGERIRAEIEVNITWESLTTPIPWVAAVDRTFYGNCFTYTDAEKKLERNSGSFITDGFSVGDTCKMMFGDSNGDSSWYLATITAMSATILYFSATPETVSHVTLLDSNYYYFHIVGTTPLTALIFKYGLIANDEPFSDISKVSNNEQAYYCSGIGLIIAPSITRDTSPIDMTKIGNYKDWINKAISGGINATCEYVQDVGNYQQYKIIHDFIVTPFFLEAWEQNLTDNTIPDLYSGLNSLKYAFQLDFRTVLSNPNTSKIVTVDNILGSVAYFNENFNGFNNNYSIDSTTYKDSSGNTIASINPSDTYTEVTITVSKTSGSFNAGDPFGLMISYLPKASEYTNTIATDLEDNFLFDNAINDEGASVSTGLNSIITNCSAAITSSKLVITARITYTTAQQLKINEFDKYILGVLVADDTLTAGASDKIMLLAAFDQYSIESESTLFGVDTNEWGLFIHPQEITDEPIICAFWNEDGIIVNIEFWLETSKQAKLNALKFCVVAYNDVTEEYFILDSYSFNLTSSVITPDHVQHININDTRGYILPDGDSFNNVRLYNGTLTGTKQYYTLQIGQKIPWEDWKKNFAADTVFFDSAKENNNLNFKSSNYSLLEDYDIRFCLIPDVIGITVDTWE